MCHGPPKYVPNIQSAKRNIKSLENTAREIEARKL